MWADEAIDAWHKDGHDVEYIQDEIEHFGFNGATASLVEEMELDKNVLPDALQYDLSFYGHGIDILCHALGVESYYPTDRTNRLTRGEGNNADMAMVCEYRALQLDPDAARYTTPERPA